MVTSKLLESMFYDINKDNDLNLRLVSVPAGYAIMLDTETVFTGTAKECACFCQGALSLDKLSDTDRKEGLLQPTALSMLKNCEFYNYAVCVYVNNTVSDGYHKRAFSFYCKVVEYDDTRNFYRLLVRESVYPKMKQFVPQPAYKIGIISLDVTPSMTVEELAKMIVLRTNILNREKGNLDFIVDLTKRVSGNKLKYCLEAYQT